MNTTATLIEISDLPRAVVFAALYNNAVVGDFPARTPLDGHMTITVAQYLLDELPPRKQLVEVQNGRVIGVDFAQDEFDPTAYNAANDKSNLGLAEKIIEHVRRTLEYAIKDFWVVTPPTGG